MYRWILKREQAIPKTRSCQKAGAGDAKERLKNVYSYTERQRDGIIGTAAVQLKVYGHPAAARTAKRGEGLTPEQLFANGEANTLYIVAGREHQQLLAPLVVTLLSSLLHYLAETENREGHGLWPPALFALDETANIAPLQDLPQILATSLPGARFLTVWHSVAQMHRHYGPAGRRGAARALPGQAVPRVDHRPSHRPRAHPPARPTRLRTGPGPRDPHRPSAAAHDRRRRAADPHPPAPDLLPPAPLLQGPDPESDRLMKPKISALLLAQALVAVAVLAAAGGLRLSVIAALAAAGVLLTRRRASRTVAAGVLTAAAIVVIATGQAKSQPARYGTPIARPATSASDLELITEPQAGNAPFLALIAGARHSVTLTMYELEDPAIEHALAQTPPAA